MATELGEARRKDTPAPGLIATLVVLGASFSVVLGVQLVSPVLPAMQDDLGLSTLQTGAIVTAFSTSAVVMTLPMGFLADWLGARYVLASSLFVYGCTGLATVAVHSFGYLILLRVGQGVGSAGIVSLTISIIVDLTSGERQAHLQSYRVATMSGAEFVLPLLGGTLLHLTGHWQVPFLLYVIPLALGPVTVLVLPRRTRTRKLARSYGPALARAVTNRAIVGLSIAGFARWWLKFGVFAYLPLYLANDLDIGPSAIGAVIAVQGIVGALVATQAGRLGIGRAARVALVAGTCASGALVAMFTAVGSLWWVVLLCVVFGFADGLAGPLVNSFIGLAAPAATRATVVALSGTVRSIGKAAAPLAVGACVVAAGFPAGFVLAGSLGLAAPFYLRTLLGADREPDVP